MILKNYDADLMLVMILGQVALAIRDDDIHEPTTKLICIEVSRDLSLNFIKKLCFLFSP
jgi:hypothetical protein